MADLTLTGVTADGRVTGTGFTKTTTTVYVDDASVPFTFISETELQLDPPPVAGSTVSAEKGGVTSDEVTVGADDPDQPEGHTADTSTTAEGNDDMTDASKSEMDAGASAGAAEKTAQNPPPVELGTYKEGHLPGANVNEAVHQTPVQRIEEDLGIGVRDPYPTGNPPDPEDAFQQQHGYRRGQDPLLKQRQLSGKLAGEK